MVPVAAMAAVISVAAMAAVISVDTVLIEARVV